MTLADRARNAGFTFRWEDDWLAGNHLAEYGPGSAYDPAIGGCEPESCEWVGLIAPGGSCVASLGCVDDAADDYRAFVEVGLAVEAENAVTAVLLRRLADRLSLAPDLTSQGADLMVRLVRTANELEAGR